MIKSIFCAAFLTFLLGSCSKLEEPDNVKATDKLEIIFEKNILEAKGNNTTVIYAKVPKDAGVLDVTFTATAGTFTAVAAKTIKQMTDSLSGENRYASVIYVADTNAATVYITAEATNARTRNTITVTK